MDLDDPSRGAGVKFLQPNAKKLMVKELAYVILGLLSDPPGIAMYRRVGVHPTTGFEITSSNRSTCQLEGMHTGVQRLSAKQGGKRMGRRLMRGKTREHNQNWNVKMMIKSGDMHNAGHHDYELLDRLSDIQQRLKGTTSSTNDGGAIPGIANHRRTPRDASVVARKVLPASATEAEWSSANGVTIAAPLTTESELRSVLPHSSALSLGNYAAAGVATGLSLPQKATNARIAGIAGFQEARSMLGNRGHPSRMTTVRAAVPANRPVTAPGITRPAPTAMQQPALLPASSSAQSASVHRFGSLDMAAAEEECERDSDSDDDDDDDDDEHVADAQPQASPPGSKRTKKQSMKDLREHRRKLREDPQYGSPAQKEEELARHSNEKRRQDDYNRKRQRR